MRTSKAERVLAKGFSEAVDRLIRDPMAEVDEPERVDPGLIATARQLAQLPAMLGPVDPYFEQEVMHQVRAGFQRRRLPPRLRPGWAAAGVVAILLTILLLTPLGQTAVASFVAVFTLGRTEVSITPVDTPSVLQVTAVARSTAVQERLSLSEAQARVPFTIPQPAYLPPSYRLMGVNSYTYPDLSAWVPQPLFIELVYRDNLGQECVLRLYPIVLGDKASISRMNLEAAPIRAVEDVDVNGNPGVLLQLGTKAVEAAWQEVVWEQDDLILALSATEMTTEGLLRVARSVR